MREWIVTNGLGSYASLTHANETTRKFHGLLVASLNPPTKRWVFVSNVEDKLTINNTTYNLRNYKPTFEFDIFPSFSYDIEGIKLRKTVFMEHEKNTTAIKYEIHTRKPLVMTHSPIVNSRHFYDLTNKWSVLFQQEPFDHGVCIRPDNTEKTLKIILRNSTYTPSEYWLDFSYEKDRERNDASEDHAIRTGDFSKILNSSAYYYLTFTLEDETESKPSAIYEKEIRRKKQLLQQANLGKKFEKLVLSTDNFVVSKDKGKSIVAGYHWFSDWGRDTLIALPGIALVTKRFEDAKQILLSFSKYCNNGLIPNAFMDRDSVAVYNTVDASLWYIDRVYQYLRYTNDQDTLNKLWNTLNSIVEGYKNGTDYGIHMDNDYLISHGEGLTWMDVKIGDHCPTPRAKKAVEIQALWYNALQIMSNFSHVLGKDDAYCDLAEHVKENFVAQYDQQYDVIDTKDTSQRPNQIFLVSLDFSMIEKPLQEKIVTDVEEKLVTNFGLRTLSPDDPRYKGTYLGNYNRDEAYHNGTVWPWLLGSFIKAFVKVKNNTKQSRDYAYQNFLKPMLNVMGEQWDGSIYEIFDGGPPYCPRGCITQAWSVAEILRSWVEDIGGISPPYEKKFLLHEIGV